MVKLSYEDENCREHILSFAFEDWWETDFSAFYHQTRSKLYLQCLEPTALYALSYADYQRIVQQYSLSNYFLQKSINGHIANQHRILSLLTDSPKSRYELFISSGIAIVNRRLFKQLFPFPILAHQVSYTQLLNVICL
ncbi:Crp/Fnr family transcriptional regulator, partial [Sphingobacterium multivorum]|uniref:Crp/Fnr family transcriptional regulator n=1 Tax=Sphingobacterium multivorum TaxID=28454 RepID=UPI003DA39C8D